MSDYEKLSGDRISEQLKITAAIQLAPAELKRHLILNRVCLNNLEKVEAEIRSFVSADEELGTGVTIDDKMNVGGILDKGKGKDKWKAPWKGYGKEKGKGWQVKGWSKGGFGKPTGQKGKDKGKGNLTKG